MNYIGSKLSLLSFIHSSIRKMTGNDLGAMAFCDLFAGTGVVGRYFKPKTKKVISNDLEYYSYVLNRNYIGNCSPWEDAARHIGILNNLKGKAGFITQNYCRYGSNTRQYFSPENGKRMDAIRLQIEHWFQAGKINEDQYFFLLASLLESADKIANTASVYGAYLKHLKSTAQKTIQIIPAIYECVDTHHDVYQEDANDLIRKVEGDILYLDPPYNHRQYGANYHLLNSIALYKPFKPKGITGLPEYNISAYCRKREAADQFSDLIRNAQFKYIFLSYNNEGIMTFEEIQTIMTKYGKYDLSTQTYQRFKADKTEKRQHKARKTIECIHFLEKRG